MCINETSHASDTKVKNQENKKRKKKKNRINCWTSLRKAHRVYLCACICLFIRVNIYLCLVHGEREAEKCVSVWCILFTRSFTLSVACDARKGEKTPLYLTFTWANVSTVKYANKRQDARHGGGGGGRGDKSKDRVNANELVVLFTHTNINEISYCSGW